MPPSDDPLPSSVADLAELGRVFAKYRLRLLAMLRRRIDPKLARRVEAEDVLQEVFVEACDRWAQFKELSPESTYAWLFGVALHRLYDANARHTTRGRDVGRDRPLPELSSDQLAEKLIDRERTPGAAAAHAEDGQRVRQALDRLKHDDREALYLRYVDGLKYREVGALLGIAESAATLRCLRALERLSTVVRELGLGGGSTS